MEIYAHSIHRNKLKIAHPMELKNLGKLILLNKMIAEGGKMGCDFIQKLKANLFYYILLGDIPLIQKLVLITWDNSSGTGFNKYDLSPREKVEFRDQHCSSVG